MGRLTIISGNIVSDEILALGDAIVLPTNPMMRCGAGVSGAIFAKAGVDDLEQYCEHTFGISYYNEPGVNEMKVTDVRVTPGFQIPTKIIFAQGPKIWDYDDFDTAMDLLLQTYENVLQVSADQGLKSVLIPALGTGDYGFSHEETAQPVIHLLRSFTRGHNLNLFFVVLTHDIKVIYDQY